VGDELVERLYQIILGVSNGMKYLSFKKVLMLVDRWLSFLLFLSVIVLSVLLRYTDSDYPFGIFKLFFLHFSGICKQILHCSCPCKQILHWICIYKFIRQFISRFSKILLASDVPKLQRVGKTLKWLICRRITTM
jgi:hypothetical protein